MTRIGVLALQGDFLEHRQMLERVSIPAVEVRKPQQLDEVDGLIIPGGESTTIGKLLVAYGLLHPLRERIAAGWPVWGTCAGAILLARDIGGLDQPLLATMDIVVRRNAFGRQADSFEVDLDVPRLGALPVRAIFIRAPRIIAAGTGVEVLARLADGTIAAARQGRLLATAFHPELTPDTRFHRYFAEQVVGGAAER
ncbi:MAG: pyridoxal 5'-phosphate synthase glutaminase subunit PdxT [Chloroflexi bacterium]|nr:pyridoxal 5'-phosphate synthase glutaminase subunit PdxT [Chloroflexota bacterium]